MIFKEETNIASFRLFKALNKHKLNTEIYCCNKKVKVKRLLPQII